MSLPCACHRRFLANATCHLEVLEKEEKVAAELGRVAGALEEPAPDLPRHRSRPHRRTGQADWLMPRQQPGSLECNPDHPLDGGLELHGARESTSGVIRRRGP